MHIARQEKEPAGWDSEKFGGPFPDGGTITIKMLVPPTNSSFRNMDNFHTVTFILAARDNPTNHLKLGPRLRRIISHNCTCKSGDRTNSGCCHGAAAVILLFGPKLFRTAKVNESRTSDPER